MKLHLLWCKEEKKKFPLCREGDKLLTLPRVCMGAVSKCDLAGNRPMHYIFITIQQQYFAFLP